MYYLGIDLGGTNVAVGIVADNQIIGSANCNTKAFHMPAEIVQDMYEIAKQAAKEAGISLEQIETVGIGTPGTVNPVTGVVGLAANLGFHNTALGKLAQERFQKSVYLENDANAATFGEMRAGGAKGYDNVVMITLGTGIGGGIIINGKIYSGFNYKGAEIGHCGMVYNGVPCTCGRNGCIEAYCSVTALIRITREAMQLNAGSKMWEITQGSLDPVNGRTAFDAMRMGDSAAQAVVNQYTDYLADAVSSMISIFQPEVVVIGGGISKEGETLLGPIRERAYPKSFNHDPANCAKIVKAELGNDAGIIGAALLGAENAQHKY